MKLTFYLFKESVTEFGQAIKEAKFTGDDAFHELTPKKNLPFEAKAYYQPNRQTRPKWLDFLVDHFEVDEEEIFNTTNSLLILIKTEGRLFAVTKGYGFAAIARHQLERGFGLRVALNEIDPDQIRSVDARKIDVTTKQKRVFLNRNSPLYEFDFDVDEDLLNLISGYPSDESIGKKLVGSDSLGLTGDVELPGLGEKCTALLASFLKEDYKEHFGFIDHLRVVKDKTLIAELEAILTTALTHRKTEKLMLAYPQIDNMSQIERFKLIYRRRSGYVEEVDLQSVYNFLHDAGLLDVAPRAFGIVGLDSNDNALTQRFSLHDYLVFETTRADQRFVLTLGDWFELDSDYVEEVDHAMGLIEEISDSGFLPPMRRGQREDDYNAEAAESKDLLLLDKQLFSPGGQDKIEVSDLLSSDREFICVKKYNGSSTLSHLFGQGYVSAACFTDDRSYREFILNHCPDDWPTLFDIDQPERATITYVFAIASAAEGRLVEALPFFSKVNLRQACKSIERLGFKLRVYKIAYEGAAAPSTGVLLN